MEFATLSLSSSGKPLYHAYKPDEIDSLLKQDEIVAVVTSQADKEI